MGVTDPKSSLSTCIARGSASATACTASSPSRSPIVTSGPAWSKNASSGRTLPAAPCRKTATPPRSASTRRRKGPTKSVPTAATSGPTTTGWQPKPTSVAMPAHRGRRSATWAPSHRRSHPGSSPGWCVRREALAPVHGQARGVADRAAHARLPCAGKRLDRHRGEGIRQRSPPVAFTPRPAIHFAAQLVLRSRPGGGVAVAAVEEYVGRVGTSTGGSDAVAHVIREARREVGQVRTDDDDRRAPALDDHDPVARGGRPPAWAPRPGAHSQGHRPAAGA